MNNFGGGMDMGKLMKQAQKMQKDMELSQEKLESQEIEGSSGGGMVKVKINGKKRLLDIKIDPQVIDPDEAEELEDLVMAAINQALEEADKLSSDEMSKVMPNLPKGFKIPGF